MTHKDTDILISGGGIAGLTAACAFGAVGYSVLCVDPAPPVTQAADPTSDLRSTAFLQPARATLTAAGIWQFLEPHATPLQIMRLADAGGAENEVRKVADFDAAEVSDLPFGWNFPNWLLRRELLKRIDTLADVTFLTGVSTTGLTTRDTEALARLSNGQSVRVKLVVAADGRNSPVRSMLNIGVKTWRYGQKALAFTVSHTLPHQNVSTEIHRSGGPFTLVPLPDRDGKHHSAIVWMETGARAKALADMPVAEFTQSLNLRSCGVLGELTLASRRTLWPIISQRAERLAGQRTALVAEAAHVIPPIGAQGLNMSLKDIQCLLDLFVGAEDIGAAALLDRYNKQRMPDIRARVTGVDMLNRAAMAQSPSLRNLRMKGLSSLHGLKPLRKVAMQAGLGHK
jgi:2-octaprenyl-6-methoxyphenol hydroxylase